MPNQPAPIRPTASFAPAANRQETLTLDASVPLRLDVPGAVWLVHSGKLDLFAVGLVRGEPVGARYPLCQIADGEAMFAIPAFGEHSIVAVGRIDTVVEALTHHDFDARPAPWRVALVERWVALLTAAAFGSAPAWPERMASPGDKLELTPGQSLYAQRDIAWVCTHRGCLTVAGEPVDAAALVPLAAGLAVHAATAAEIELITTAEALEGGTDILGNFHALVLSVLGRLVAEAAQASDRRLGAREETDRRSLQAALEALTNTAEAAPDRNPVVSSDPAVAAFAAVAEHHGILLPRMPYAPSSTETAARSIARANGVGLRQVLLRGTWWRSDSGAMLAWRGEDRQPIGLLPTGTRSYRAWDPAKAKSVPVDDRVAREIQATAVTAYRPLPRIIRSVLPLLAFSLRGVGRELATIAGVGVLASVMAALFPLAMGFLLETAVPRAEIGQVVAAILGLAVAALGAGVFNLVQSIALLRLEGRLETAMQPALMQRLLTLPVKFFRSFASGELTNRVLSIQVMRRLLAGTSLQSMLASVFVAANFGVILFISPLLGLVSGALVVFAAFVSAILAIGELQQERARVDLRGQEDGLVVQLVQGIAKIRVAAAETRIFAVWARIFARQKRHFRAGQRFALAGEVFTEVLPLFAYVALFFVAARALLFGGDNAPPELGLGGFLAINAAFGQLLAAIMMMSRALVATLELVPLFERLRPITDAVPETSVERREAGPLSGGVEVSHVVFRYTEGSRPALDDVSLKIEPGSFVAFVGPSGSGKSTLMRLLLGFETPERGDILYDGQSISTLDVGSLRRQIGVVLQHGRIATGSIFENITGGLPYTLSDAWAAARLAGLDEDIEAMPMGVHTVLIEGSSTLSGGQRQRLMIARALISRPRLLLFDEATSALDNRSQALVTRSLNALRTTRIVIAHRLSTVRRADCIFVLDSGRLVESGDFDTLIAQDGLFARLARRQII